MLLPIASNAVAADGAHCTHALQAHLREYRNRQSSHFLDYTRRPEPCPATNHADEMHPQERKDWRAEIKFLVSVKI